MARSIRHEVVAGIGGVDFVLLDGLIPVDVGLEDRLVSHIPHDTVAMFFPEVMGTCPRISVWVNGVRCGELPSDIATKYGRKIHRLQEKVRRPIAVRATLINENQALLRLAMPVAARL